MRFVRPAFFFFILLSVIALPRKTESSASPQRPDRGRQTPGTLTPNTMLYWNNRASRRALDLGRAAVRHLRFQQGRLRRR